MTFLKINPRQGGLLLGIVVLMVLVVVLVRGNAPQSVLPTSTTFQTATQIETDTPMATPQPTHRTTSTMTRTPTSKPVTLEPTVPSTTTIPESPTPMDAQVTEVTQILSVQAVSSIFGIEYHKPNELLTVKEAGALWVRRNALLWSDVEPTEGARNWEAVSQLEEELITAAEQGQRVILIVRSTPTWAQQIPGSYCGAIKRKKLSAFALFMHDVVARYSQHPYNVRYWEIWNEPDVDPAVVKPDEVYGCWGDPQDDNFGGGYYAEMLRQVYPQIKAADPKAQVLIGGLLLDCDPINPPETSNGSGQYRDCTSSRFLEGILEAGGGDFFDGVSFHAYDYYYGTAGQYGNGNWHSSWKTTGPVLMAKANFLRDVLQRYGYSGKYLMNTEVALLCGSTGTEDMCKTQDFASTKADYVAQAYAAALAQGLRANIWYSLIGWRGSALTDRNLKPLWAFQAYRFAAEQLGGATFTAELKDYPNVMGFRFDREATQLWVLWALGEDAQEVSLTSQPSAMYDALGNPLEISRNVLVTLAPLYVLWQP